MNTVFFVGAVVILAMLIVVLLFGLIIGVTHYYRQWRSRRRVVKWNRETKP